MRCLMIEQAALEVDDTVRYVTNVVLACVCVLYSGMAGADM